MEGRLVGGITFRWILEDRLWGTRQKNWRRVVSNGELWY